MKHCLVGGKILIENEFIFETICMEDGVISGIGTKSGGVETNVSGLTVLPGIVDLHGDAFERQLLPRPGVLIDYPLAFLDTDRQLLAAGITTAFHALTYSWEPGLRSARAAHEFISALDLARSGLLCDAKLHLRIEVHNPPAFDDARAWIDENRLDLLSFNDHTEMFLRQLERPGHARVFEARSGLKRDQYRALLEKALSHKEKAPELISGLARSAKEAGIPMASHDEDTPEIRQWYHDLGCHICEFPVNAATARQAGQLGDTVVLGGPNAMRGRSQSESRMSAAEAIQGGLCHCLASDYHYPSLLQAPYTLARSGRLSLAEAWPLVSAHPAGAAGLNDRGRLEEGLRADLILVDESNPALPSVTAVFSAGRPVYLVGNYNGFPGRED